MQSPSARGSSTLLPFLLEPRKHQGMKGRLGGFLPWVLSSEQAQEGSVPPAPAGSWCPQFCLPSREPPPHLQRGSHKAWIAPKGPLNLVHGSTMQAVWVLPSPVGPGYAQGLVQELGTVGQGLQLCAWGGLLQGCPCPPRHSRELLCAQQQARTEQISLGLLSPCLKAAVEGSSHAVTNCSLRTAL